VRRPRYSIIKEASVGDGSRVYDQVNLTVADRKEHEGRLVRLHEEGVTIGDDCKIRPFVFIPQA